MVFGARIGCCLNDEGGPGAGLGCGSEQSPSPGQCYAQVGCYGAC